MDDVNEDIIRHWLILERLYEDILDGLYLKTINFYCMRTVKIVIIYIFQNFFIPF